MSFMKYFDHLKILFEDIVLATNNFDPNKTIGFGGFGSVYKGEISSPEGLITAAFKRLDRRLGQGNIEFWKEIMMLSAYKHENLISLEHFCIEGDEMILVYEYASRGSLDRYLSDASILNWVQRLKICVGSARGLCFLHDPKETQQRVLHRDIKSANILLDENWTAKVSDFGLSKLGPANQPHTYLVTHGVGTPGYCDPLYMELGFLSKESDVYSFGVVLFEVLCGRLCYEYRNGELTGILVPKWRRCYEEMRLDEILLPGLKEQMDLGSLRSFSAIAYRCVKKVREERPTMADIMEQLEFSLVQQEVPENFGKRLDCPNYVMQQNMRASQPNYDVSKPETDHRERTSLKLNSQMNESVDNDHRLKFDLRSVSFQEWDTVGYTQPLPVGDGDASDDSYDSEAADDDVLPAVESLQISGDPLPGRELQASGYSVNGTTSCNFEWVRHIEDGSVSYIDGAKQPTYLVTADDVDTYLAIEVQPMDNRKRKGELVKVFANEHGKIVCDPDMHDHIRKALQTGYAEHRLSLWTGYLDIWEPVTLVIKKDGIKIKGGGTPISEKFSPSATVFIPHVNSVEFSIIGLGNVERRLRVEQESATAIGLRDIIVLTLRCIIKRAVEKKAKKKFLFF